MGDRPIGGVFVGGASRRMGEPKGLLVGPDGRRLVERALAVLADAGLEAALVGEHVAYAGIGPFVRDAEPDAGPLAGLVGLLEHADGRRVVALACDMPFVTADDVRALLAIEGPIVAPRREGRWEPLCACYGPEVLAPARERLALGRRSLTRLIEAVGAVEASIEAAHLVDWDSPEDITAS